MLNLENFFQPLNASNILIYLLFVFACDVIGLYAINLFLPRPNILIRFSSWLVGLGVITFIYFLLHFYLPYSSPLIVPIVAVFFLFSAKNYLSRWNWLKIINFISDNKILFIIVIVILPKIIVKVSLPPYMWDEMAYHYISPFTLFNEKTWVVENSFYFNLPRLLETSYVLLFSLSKTYSIARLLHFTIFMTFVFVAYAFIKERIGKIAAIFFAALVVYYPENFLLWSTFGYVDVGTTSFVMISLFLTFEYLLAGNIKNIVLAIALFGMAVGSKYSALTQFLSFGLLLVPILVIKKNISFFKSKNLILAMVLFGLLGGYWYIKNTSFTGNPIYPYLFGCKFEQCEYMSMSYTSPFTFANALPIYRKVFLGNKFMEVLFIVSVFLTSFFINKKLKSMLIYIFIFVGLEIALIKTISGYDARYFYHWPILASLILVMPLSAFNKKTKS